MTTKTKQSERDYDVSRKREGRAEARTVIIPACEDLARREELEQDDAAWLRFYCHELFWYAFTPQQQAMIEAIRNATRYGGDQALAASRGEGKTKLFERMMLKYTISGEIKFAVLFAATASAAENSLQSMRDEVEQNDRLCADYPEVCTSVRAIADVPNRAHYQLVSGHRHDNGEVYEGASSRFTWCGHEIIYPNVPGAPAASGVIATRGLESAVRGLNKKNRRPEVVGIDDPDTEGTISSLEQAYKLERRIDRGIAGLGGQQRGVARVLLSTLQKTECVSAWFTDPKRKPSFKGRRFRYLVKPPDNPDLWQEYVHLRRQNQQATDDEGNFSDEFARGAHAFYLANREAMDAGAEVANPHRFDGSLLPDGTQMELSSLQHYYNEVARIGQDAVSTEYDNSPTEEAATVASGITTRLVQTQLNGFARADVPPGCTVITHCCDIGKLKGFNWIVRAWEPNGTGHTIDYGVMSVAGAKYGSDEGLERAIYNAVLRRHEEFKSQAYGGGQIGEVLSTYDIRWQTDAVLAAVAKIGLGAKGIMGIGKSNGAVKGTFRDVITNSPTRRKCGTNGAYEELHVGPYGKQWAIHANCDKWKEFEHERWLTARDKPGCMFLFGEVSKTIDRMSPDERSHELFAESICSEVQVDDGQQRKFITKGKKNDYFDTAWHSCCAASMRGIRVLAAKDSSTGKQRMSLRQYAERANAK